MTTSSTSAPSVRPTARDSLAVLLLMASVVAVPLTISMLAGRTATASPPPVVLANVG